jgi:hypothetical protein
MLNIANAYEIEKPDDIKLLVAALEKEGFTTQEYSYKIWFEDTNENNRIAGYINPMTLMLCVYTSLYALGPDIPSVRLDEHVLSSMEKAANVYMIRRMDPVVTGLKENGFALYKETSKTFDDMKVHDTRDYDAIVGYIDSATRELFADLSTRLDEFAPEFEPRD